MYLLDTNICIYIIKQKPVSVLKRFEALPLGSMSMSLVTFGELQHGALRSRNRDTATGILDELAEYIPVLAMSNDVATAYANTRADLAAKGTPIGNNDLWIAAHAITLGYTLVSNNVKEFERVEGLKLENWV